jgi:hypothetical protein
MKNLAKVLLGSLACAHLTEDNFRLTKRTSGGKLPEIILPWAKEANALVPQISVMLDGVSEPFLMQIDLSSNLTTVIDSDCVQFLDGFEKSCRSQPTYTIS